jgi:hypothetical protein
MQKVSKKRNLQSQKKNNLPMSFLELKCYCYTKYIFLSCNEIQLAKSKKSLIFTEQQLRMHTKLLTFVRDKQGMQFNPTNWLRSSLFLILSVHDLIWWFLYSKLVIRWLNELIFDFQNYKFTWVFTILMAS